LEPGLRIISDSAKQYYCEPYLQKLDEIKQKMVKINQQIDLHGKEEQVYNWKTLSSYLKRKIIESHLQAREFSKQ
jgi:hypothetical protein